MELILADITPKIGSLHHSWIYEITFVDIRDLQVYTCVVDESMRNFTRSHWDTIVTNGGQLGLYTGLRKIAKRDKDHLPVISADSVPQLIEPLTEPEVMFYIERRKEDLGLD
jgi:hypothetical protein